jgi:MoaA/NifB/PqqE/SkfB family radical SAM enzyme
VLFNSNAILLTDDWQRALLDAGLDEYRVSIDAATSETYARVRGVEAFDTVTDNLRRFARLTGRNGSLRPSLWFVAVRENVQELPLLVDLAADLGILEVYVQRMVKFYDGLANDQQSLYRHLRETEEQAIVEAEARAGELGIAMRASGLRSPHNSLRGYEETERTWLHCRRPWTATYITVNGNVLPCCISPFSTQDYPALIQGNIYQTSFAEIWNGPAYIERRVRLQSDHPVHPCEMCGMHWSL